jgi:hypothetical protein
MISRLLRTHGLLLAVALPFIFAGGFVLWSHHTAAETSAAQFQTPEESADVYVRFDMEAYDLIEKNYWQQASDAQFTTLFQAALQKAVNSQAYTLATTTRAGVALMLESAIKSATSTDAKKALAVNVVQVVLYNLPPAGRDQLLSKQQEVALRQEVSNIKPNTDLYQDVGAQKGANAEQIAAAYHEKVAALSHATSSEAKQALAAAEHAQKILSNSTDKALYDHTGAEPTTYGHIFGHTLYFALTQISPNTLQEFALAVDQASTTPGLDSMIIDVRGNIGGAFDFLQGFLGLFIGQNQYAFDVFHQGTYDTQRTTQPKFAELSRYTEIAILADNMTQSTAEVTVAAFKRFHLATIVGTTTRGWGTVEDTYPIKTQIDTSTSYALLLVNHITLRDDGLPIEGRGVDPDISTASPNWQNKLSNFLRSASLIDAIKKIAPNPPLH